MLRVFVNTHKSVLIKNEEYTTSEGKKCEVLMIIFCSDRIATYGHMIQCRCIWYKSARLFIMVLLNVLVLQLDRLPVHKYTLALVWLWFPPHPYIRRKLHDHLFLWAFKK